MHLWYSSTSNWINTKLELTLRIRSSLNGVGCNVWEKHNFKPSYDYIFGTVEDTYALFFKKKKNNITINLDIYALHLPKQK